MTTAGRIVANEESPLDHRGERVWDGVGLVLALLYALPSLALPFGRDQAAFWYMGWTWLEGGLPYVNAVDHKPPAIYGTYALAQMLFGLEPWAYRLLELVAVFPLSWVIAAVAFSRGRVPPGALGLAAGLMVTLYFTGFGFWETGQAEFWEGGFLMLGLLFAQRERAALAGLCVAQACLYKMTAVVPGLLPFGMIALASWKRDGRGLRGGLSASSVFILGGLGIVLLWLLPYLMAGEVGALWEVVVQFNIDYLHRDVYSLGLSNGMGLVWGALTPTFSIIILLTALALYRRRRGPWSSQAGQLMAMVALCVASVFLQGKFFLYHWGVVLPALSGLGVWALRSLAPSPRWTAIATAATLLMGHLLGPFWPVSSLTFAEHSARAWRSGLFSLGEDPRDLTGYHGPNAFRAASIELIVQTIARDLPPETTLCVEGFEPSFYMGLRARCPSPFFALHLLEPEMLGPGFAHWRVRHEEALLRDPPDLIIGLFWAMKGRGEEEEDPYELLFSEGIYSVLRRRALSPALPAVQEAP